METGRAGDDEEMRLREGGRHWCSIWIPVQEDVRETKERVPVQGTRTTEKRKKQ